MPDAPHISQTGMLVIFTGLAFISLSLAYWIFTRDKTDGKAEGKAARMRRTRFALGGILVGIALAAGGMLWFRTAILGFADERTIVTAMYQAYRPANPDEGGFLVWHQTATDFQGPVSFARLSSAFKGISLETYNNFLAANEDETTVAPDLDLGVQTVLIGPEEAERIRDEGALPGLAALGWLGIHSHSRPGFNADYTQALIYHSAVCGPGCGGGNLHYFVKTELGWEARGVLRLWTS